MPMLAFVPWLRLREAIRADGFTAFPYKVGSPLPAETEPGVPATSISSVLSQYRLAADRPIAEACLLVKDGVPLGADLDEVTRAALFRFGRHLAVAGLSSRTFAGGHFEYTSSGHYEVIIQAFTEPFSGGVVLSHRRKGGSASVNMGQTDGHFLIPAHLVVQESPGVNARLVVALDRAKDLPVGAREHLDASIVQFLLANSDSPDVLLEAQSIATYAALERLVNASQRRDDFISKTMGALTVVDQLGWVEFVRQELDVQPSDGASSSSTELWLKDLYKLRGAVAHGKPAKSATTAWSQNEHLVAGAYVYPLAVKCVLAKHGLYSLDIDDVARIVGLDGLLEDRPFFPDRDGVDEPEEAFRARCGWLRQTEAVNLAILGVSMSASLGETLNALGDVEWDESCGPTDDQNEFATSNPPPFE